MASTQLQLFRQMRLGMERLSQTLRQIPDPKTMMKYDREIGERSIAMAYACSFTSMHPERAILQPEYAAFITSLSDLISLVVLHLHKTDQVLLTELWSRWFLINWSFMIASFQAFFKWGEMLEGCSSWGQSPSDASLRGSLALLLSWILAASRSNHWAWRALTNLGILGTQQILLAIQMPMHSIIDILSTPSKPTCIATLLCEMPKELFPALCCLVCEQAGDTANSPQPTRFTTPSGAAEFALKKSTSQWRMTEFGTGIKDLVTLSIAANSRALLELVSHPAAIEVMKRIFAFQSLDISLRQPIDPTTVCMSLVNVLSKLMRKNTAMKATCTNSDISGTGRSESNDLAFRPVPRRVVSHWSMVHALCTHAPPGASATIADLDDDTISKLNLLYAVLDTWDEGVLATITKSQCCILLTLVHHCSSIAKLWMQSFKTVKQNSAAQTGQQPAMQTQRTLQTQARVGKDVVPVLWDIVCLVSYFSSEAVTAGLLSGSLAYIEQLQQQHQQQSRLNAHRELTVLQDWCGLVGPAVLFESLIRGHADLTQIDLAFTVRTVLSQLTMSQNIPGTPAGLACLSMVATLRKLIHNTMPGLMQDSEQGLTQEASLAARIPDVMQDIGHCMLFRSHQTNLLQLKSILLTIVVQRFHSQVRSASSLNLTRKDLQQVSQDILQRYECLQHGMPELLYNLLSVRVMGLSTTRIKAEMGQAFGRHALTYFSGRLLPGCCHLGCTNMYGVSEAALPTLLCSGCRRARYCCVECQRAAWIEGGHSSLCDD